MALKNFNRLFSSDFYIEGSYAQGYVPVLLSLIESGFEVIEASEEPTVQVTRFNTKGASNATTGTSRNVAVVEIKNPIMKFSNYFSVGTKDIFSEISRLDKDPNVAGIVLDIDSGGGQVYGTPEFYDNLRSIETPLVAYTDGLMCSAAYYIGAATDYIIANKRADAIGSIGAYAQFFDFAGFWEKNGAKLHTVYADKSSEKNKGYRDVLEGNYETYIKTSLNPTVETFIADMKAARPTLSEKVFNGGTWNGPESLELNLVDSLGTLQDAISKAFELSSENPKSTNTMSKPKSYPNLEATLGLSEPLATNDNGSFLNEEQKTALEQRISGLETSVKTEREAKEKAEQDLAAANEAHQTALDEVQGSSDAAATSLREAATLAGVEDLAEDASVEDINTALTARIQELNAKPGASHTRVGSSDPEADATPEYVNKDAYRKLHNR